MRSFSNGWLREDAGGTAFTSTYLEHFDAISERLETSVTSHRVLGPLLDQRAPNERREARQLARDAFELAAAGDWDAYAAVLQRQGALYATLGMTFGDWHSLTAQWSKELLPILVHRLAEDRANMVAALQVMQDFAERALLVVSEAYLEVTETDNQRRAAKLRTWELLFDRVGFGVCITDPDVVNLERYNDVFMQLFGWPSRDAVRTVEGLFSPEAFQSILREVAPVAAAKGIVTHEAVCVRADGTRFDALFESVSCSDDPQHGRWAFVVHDLAEQRRTEALRLHGVELEAENRRIQEASRMKSEFLANMSHELRTPLNAILGFSELLHNGDVGALSEQQNEFVGEVLTSGKHLLRLINDVLDLSKVEAGKLELQPEAITLTAIVAEVLNVLRALTEKHGVTVHTHIDPDVDSVYLDPGRAKQVLYNYLANAMRFSRGTVHVTVVREDEGSFRLSVQDDGIGISPEDQARLFKDFEQLDVGRSKTHGGTGLGLALTKRLVEAQGGSVGLVSKVGVGSTFYVILPQRSSAVSALPPARRIAAGQSEAPRVLVIEDNLGDQDRIVDELVGAGYAVDTVASGAQALQAVGLRPYHAITLDLLLPDINGFALLQALRKSPGCERVPILVVSMAADQVTAAVAVQEVLQKPLRPAELVASFARLGIVPDRSGPVLVVDDDDAALRLMTNSLLHLGFGVQTARNGREGLERAERVRPCAVVLDLSMPVLDGFGFLKEFRQRPTWADVPVLVWTTQDLSRAERARLLEAATFVMAKDTDGTQSLLDAVRAYLPEPHSRR